MRTIESLRVFLSPQTNERIGKRICEIAAPLKVVPILANATCDLNGVDADIAFISRDVTGTSTKHQIEVPLQRFYDGLASSPALKWVHLHSAGKDRPIVSELERRGVAVTASAGANAEIVAQTALGGILSLGRRFPQLRRAQGDRLWKPLIKDKLPPDLRGQTAVIVGWGPVGQQIAAYLGMLGIQNIAVRTTNQSTPGTLRTVQFSDISQVLGLADWLILACPLSDTTHHLIGFNSFAKMKPDSYLINVARGEVVVEAELIKALEQRLIAGAYLDVFEHEPLHTRSPLWDAPNVIITPHTAGHSEGNERRVDDIFLTRLKDFCSDYIG